MEKTLHNSFLHILIIVIIGLISYSNTFNVPFHFDDAPNIVENYKLRDLNNFWPPSGARWFGYLTFALNYHFGGLNVTGYHIVNIAIHILNAILVYLLVVFTFRTPFFSNQHSAISSQDNLKPYLPLFIALIFVAHPIQTQAVTYIVQRFTSLATFFYLLSLVMYIKARLEVKAKVNFFSASTLTFYFLSIVSVILAMKTKEISFTLPIIVVLYEFMFFDGKIGRRLLFLVPFLLMMLIIPLTLIGLHKSAQNVVGLASEAIRLETGMSHWDYLFTQFSVLVTYVRLLFFPVSQNFDYYDYPIYTAFLEPQVFFSFFFLLSILSVGAYLHYRTRSASAEGNQVLRLISFGIYWFFITLSVESSFIPIIDVLVEHRVYLASAGALVATTTSLFFMSARLKDKWPHVEKLVFFIFLSVTCIFVTLTYTRNFVWVDELSLWKDVVKKADRNGRAYHYLGNIYSDMGRINEAIEHYNIALSLGPRLFEIQVITNNLGNAYLKQGRVDEAIKQFQTALSFNSGYAEARNNLGIAYLNKGWIDKAIEQFQAAVAIKPDYVRAHYNLYLAYKSKGLSDSAMEHLRRAQEKNSLGVYNRKRGE